jgi:hypothetical protein
MYVCMYVWEVLIWLTGVVMSAAKSSRRSAASFARRRAARARARGVVRSCWTGSDLHVDLGLGVDAQLVAVENPDARIGFGVARSEAAGVVDADDEIRVDIACAAEVAKDAKAATLASDDIFGGCQMVRQPDD